MSTGNTVRVDIWTGSCTGAVVWTPLAMCVFNDQHVAGVHVMALHGGGCQTGVLVEQPPSPGSLSHTPCGTSTTATSVSVVVIDVWLDNQCVGVIVWTPAAICLIGPHLHAVGTHTMVLYGNGCQTGAIVEWP